MRQILPVTSSLSVLHAWNTQRFTELDREEMGEERDRGHLVEKESPEEERVVKPVISLSGKLG